MFVVLEKGRNEYEPGEVIKGEIYFEVFIPCFQNRVMVKIEGRQ